jgi:hypothetical protein
VTVEDPDRIDNISVSADGGTYRLLMTEERLFEDSDEQFSQLLEKINAYIEYLQLGQFYESHPQARGKRLRVALVCRNEPVGERFRNLLNTATALFAKHGAEFYIEVIPDELLGLAPN